MLFFILFNVVYVLVFFEFCNNYLDFELIVECFCSFLDAWGLEVFERRYVCVDMYFLIFFLFRVVFVLFIKVVGLVEEGLFFRERIGIVKGF